MHDGAVKSAAVEGERIGPVAGGPTANHDGLGIGGRFAGAVIVLSWWMILMTAIYFHTWFEKVRSFPCAPSWHSSANSMDL